MTNRLILLLQSEFLRFGLPCVRRGSGEARPLPLLAWDVKWEKDGGVITLSACFAGNGRDEKALAMAERLHRAYGAGRIVRDPELCVWLREKDASVTQEKEQSRAVTRLQLITEGV